MFSLLDAQLIPSHLTDLPKNSQLSATRTYWGIDLGGTKIEGVVLMAPSPGAVLIRRRVDTESHYGYDHIIRQIVTLVDLLKTKTGLQPERIARVHLLFSPSVLLIVD